MSADNGGSKDGADLGKVLNLMQHITREFWKSKDKRMKGVNELFQNIRLLKYYGWGLYCESVFWVLFSHHPDDRWAKDVNKIRETELGWRIKQAIVGIFDYVLYSLHGFDITRSYTLIQKEDLTVPKAFVSIALFEQLQAPLTALPGQIIALLNGGNFLFNTRILFADSSMLAYISMQRIEAFLAEDEVPSWGTSLGPKQYDSENHTSESGKIGFENASFQWSSFKVSNDTAAQLALKDLNTSFPIGHLTIVTGPTGSGKSALLNALLGGGLQFYERELNCVSGKVHINKADHRVAYAGQYPWLEHATIRDNILYGCPFDRERYEMVLDVCSLENDLVILSGGDLTEIGEKGVTLSGGQRARVALARAVLAAVDMHTANHIYERCITGKIVHGRTVILITHHISLCLTKAKYLVELANGSIVRQGLVEDLRKTGQLNDVQTEEPISIEEKETAEENVIVNEADQTSGSTTPHKTRSAIKGKLVKAETRVEGRIKYLTYRTYLLAGGWFLWIITLVLLLSLRGILYLAKWGEAYDESNPETTLPIIGTLPPPYIDVKPWLVVFLIISMIGAFSTLFYIASGYYTSVRASRRLFTQMLFRLSRVPIQFFDVTPLGRIMNRFVTDFGTVDGLNQVSRSPFTVIVGLIPSFLPFAVVIAYLYLRLAPSFILASRDLRRLELTSLSPTFASFDELLHGLPHVRAFAMENWYQNRFYQKVDRFQSYDHVYVGLGSVVVFCASVFALLSGVDTGYAAVIIVQAGIFAESSRQLIRVSAQLELDFNSVERIAEYLTVPGEASAIIENCRPPAYWPSSLGGIEVKGLTVKYRPDLPPVLDGLSFEVRPGEKVGIYEVLYLHSIRSIDGIDISSIGLEDLRTRVTMISQDVSLFSGTIRSNIDPFDEHEDHECWDVLKRCHLVSDPSSDETETSRPKNLRDNRVTSLDMSINQIGSLSAGERQLLALARAILRRSKVVIMDEATSAIDFELDSMVGAMDLRNPLQVQNTIREELRDTLVITIAHRLHTIIDYDRILVLDSGKIVEFDSPAKLLSNPDGIFMQMCRKSVDWETLKTTVQSKK
ncbi:hypothetical protein Clacol_004270 [Clathrus columnatus]|uniref:P-loop containing nucleoside triphosphate hydrolase protein n=1 Tax=Clathrus columnatus TaxID=1419009 RepID=A0AAV5ABF1_9AGAM|nr:hypothetical protein Clacol_004270 [Clathrus columnatus]